MTIATELAELTPHVSDVYEPGAILSCSWGYDQTNVDFYVVVRRKAGKGGQVWLTLAPLDGHETGDGWTGTKVPGTRVGSATFRRKLHVWDDGEGGVSITSYSWAGLWSGEPASVSHYA